MITVRERDFEDFFKVPFLVYGENTHYVSPLKSDLQNYLSASKNPLFSSDKDFSYFTAYRNNKISGRIVAHVHRTSNVLYNLNRAYFGFFDCIDDDEVAAALLNAAENWARKLGLKEIVGNFNLTIAQQIGVLTAGFDYKPYVDMVYNPPHIPYHLERNGYEAFFPMTTGGTDINTLKEESLNQGRTKEVLCNPNFAWKSIKPWTISKCLKDARTLLNDSFKTNPMFVPLTPEEFAFQTQSLAAIVDSRISTLVYYKDKPAGVIICIPDINPLIKTIRSELSMRTSFEFIKYRFTNRRAVIIYYAVAREFQNQGINSAMLYRMIKNLKKAKYKELGCTWISDSNAPSLRVREKMNMPALHTLHLFRKVL